MYLINFNDSRTEELSSEGEEKRILICDLCNSVTFILGSGSIMCANCYEVTDLDQDMEHTNVSCFNSTFDEVIPDDD